MKNTNKQEEESLLEEFKNKLKDMENEIKLWHIMSLLTPLFGIIALYTHQIFLFIATAVFLYYAISTKIQKEDNYFDYTMDIKKRCEERIKREENIIK